MLKFHFSLHEWTAKTYPDQTKKCIRIQLIEETTLMMIGLNPTTPMRMQSFSLRLSLCCILLVIIVICHRSHNQHENHETNVYHATSVYFKTNTLYDG